MIDVTCQVLLEVLGERGRQHRKFGDQSHVPDGTALWGKGNRSMATAARAATERASEDGDLTWAHILTEEYWEAMAESDPAKLRDELIQVAAVAAAWVEAIDRRGS